MNSNSMSSSAPVQRSKAREIFDSTISWPLRLWCISLFTIGTTLYMDAKLKGVPVRDSFVQWDSNYYRTIAIQGYVSNMPTQNGKLLQNQNAFFPVYPYLLRFANAVIPGGDVFASLLMNIAFFGCTLVLIYLLAKNLLPSQKAKYATALFAFFPASFIFTWVYAEAVAVFFIAAGLYALSREKVYVASAFICVAAAVRPNVFVFALAPAVFILSRHFFAEGESFASKMKKCAKPVVQAFVCGVISLAGFLGFMLYLDHHTGVRMAWFRLEREAWKESTRPFSGLTSYFGTLFDGTINTKVIFVVVSTFINIALVVVLVLYMRKNKFSPMSVALSVPSMLTLFFSLANQNSVSSLRYALVALPIFIATADVLTEKKLKNLVMISLFLLMVFTFFYGWGRVDPFDMGVPV